MTKQALQTKMTTTTDWDGHLKSSYDAAQKDHTSSWVSWGKTRFRSGNRADTAINTAGQVAGATGLVAGAVAGAGVALPSAFAAGAAVTAAAAGAAVTLYALPAVIAVAAIGYWAYNKNEHNEVNQKIRTYWYAHQADPKPLTVVTEAVAMEWLGWFGDEGIANMPHLNAKLTEAKAAYDLKVRELETAKTTLISRTTNANLMVAAPGATPAQRASVQANQTSALQQITRDKDALRDKYLAVAKDLQYIKYRLERLLIYHDMLDLVVRSLTEARKGNMDLLRANIPAAYQQQLDSYKALGDNMVLMG